MDCQNCCALRAKISCLEAEIAQLRGKDVSQVDTDCISILQQRVFDNPSVSPSEIKSIDFLSLDKELYASRWDSFTQGFSSWAASNPIKAVAFIVCFEKRVRNSKAVRALLNHLRGTAATNDNIQQVLKRSIFELFAIQICAFSQEDLQMARSLLSNYLECFLAEEPDTDALNSIIQFLESDEGRVWEFIRQVAWPAFPTSAGPFQDRIVQILMALIQDLQGRFIKNGLMSRHLKDKLNGIQ